MGRQIVLLPQEVRVNAQRRYFQTLRRPSNTLFARRSSQTQYLSDRFIAVSVAVPDVGAMAEMGSKDLLPFLYDAFPLDEFSISFVPAALRSFIHHFWPAYTTALGGLIEAAEESSSELEKV